MTRRSRGKNSSFLGAKWFIILSVCLFLLISTAFAKEIYRSHQINQEISDLEHEILSLEQKNREAALFVEYLKTEQYVQEQARLKFGKQLPGEKTIILKDDLSDSTSVANGEIAVNSPIGEKEEQKNTANAVRWWNYFFNRG